MASRNKKDKRSKKKKHGRPQKPMRLPAGLPGNAVVISSPPGAARMSDVLMDFIEPFADSWRNEEELRKLLTVAQMAWNASLYSGQQRSDFIRDMEQAVPPEIRLAFRAILDPLIQRKEAHFASIGRMILSFDVTPTPSGPHVTVMSMLN